MNAPQDRIADELAGPLLELGLDLEAVELTPAGKRRVLRVAVDQDGGVTLDDVAEATRRVDEVLEASDVMGQHPYTLEVTSRGVDRPLTLERHWRRNTDRLVRVTLHEGEPVTGRVLAAGPDAVELDLDGTTTTIAYADVARALVQVELNRRARPADPEGDTDDEGTDDEGDDDAALTEEDD